MEAADERSHIVRRSNPARGSDRTRGSVTTYVAFDPETFEQVRARAIARGTSFAAEVRVAVAAGLALVGEALPASGLSMGPGSRRGGRPAVGATRRKDLMPFSSVKFGIEAFEVIRARALREGTSAAEQVRQLVEWGLDEA